LNQAVNFSVDYIGTWPASGSCDTPSHGPTECVTDAWNLCAEILNPQNNSWWAFDRCLYTQQNALKCGTEKCCTNLTLFNETVINVTTGCAKMVGMSPSVFATLRDCAIGSEGAALVKASFARTAAKKIAHTEWVYVDGTYFDKHCENPLVDCQHTDLWAEALLTFICTKIPSPKPAGCT